MSDMILEPEHPHFEAAARQVGLYFPTGWEKYEFVEWAERERKKGGRS